MAGWGNPDVDLLYDINGLAKDAPGWADRAMEYIGEYGTVAALVLLGLWAWWAVRRRSATREAAAGGFAALMWAPLAAGVALLVNIPIRHLVERPRPFVDHSGLEVLVEGKRDYSFVSDHATLTMAIGVGLFIVNRKFGLAGIAMAVIAGFCRVYMGVHYPTDVIGGLALGTAVALLLAPVALWLLTPLARSIAGSRRLGGLVWAGAPGGGSTADADSRTGAEAPVGAADGDGTAGRATAGHGPGSGKARTGRRYGSRDRDLAA